MKRSLPKKAEFGQIEDILAYFKPTKIRVSGNLIPDFTIDLTKPSKIGSVLDLINPTVTILFGRDLAYQINYKERKIKPVSPKIFERKTLLDTLNELGILGTLIYLGVIGYLSYKIFIEKKEQK